MKTIRLFNTLLAAALIVSLGACKSTGKKDNGSAGIAGEGDYVNGTPLPDRPDNGVSFTSPNVDRNQFPPVHFAFDSYTISPDDQPTLDQVTQFLKGGQNTIIIGGFTDERGTAEYNRGLGERRAEAVRNYLAQHGADGNRIQTVSFGAEMPVDPGSGEAAWAKNRRAEFGVVK
ncbi:MAG TPA: OmpA family protein [Chthoniobacteraceae bacterium]|nr:OmpA family protein [Chthoniobacteraceae bacterium]